MATLNVDYTETSNVALQKPIPGAASSNWGSILNNSLDIADGLIKTLQDMDSALVSSLAANTLDYIQLDSSHNITLKQIDLTTDVTGLLPYTSLSGAPTNVSAFNNDAGYAITSNNLGDLTDANAAKANLSLHTVATSGSYTNLVNTPTNVSEFSNDAGYLAGSNNLSDVNDAAAARSNLGLGSATTMNASDFATAAQGAKADTALQAADIVTKADLDGNGKLLTTQLPDIAVTEYLGNAADQTAMLAMRGQKGDWVTRTDTSTVFVIVSNDGSAIADWVQLTHPADAVDSVNGKTGVVTLNHADVGALPNSTYIPQSTVDFDPVGTDNSTDVTVNTTAHDYLSLSGQEITVGPVDAATDLTGVAPQANGGTGVNAIGNLDASTLGSQSSTINGQVLTANGAGVSSWTSLPGTLQFGTGSYGTYSYSVGANPPGAVTTFAMSQPAPGWLVCDGSAVSRTTYNNLFQAIGTNHGAGDGSTTFNLPNLTAASGLTYQIKN